jgi:hypothetical protein
LTIIPGEPLVLEHGVHALSLVPAGAPRARVLVVSPLFEEKRTAHRALVSVGRALAAAGAAVLLPDLRGTGNSAGTLDTLTLDDWRADLRTAAAALDGDGPLCVVGCRAGALLATELPADRLVLCQPVAQGKSYLRQLRTRRQMQDQLTGDAAPEVAAREIEGEILSDALYTGIEALKLPADRPHPDTRFVQCGATEKLQVEYTRLLAAWGDVPTRCLITEPFWHAHTPGLYAELAAAMVEVVLSPES